MADESDESLPFLPEAEPFLPEAEPVLPAAQPVLPPSPPTIPPTSAPTAPVVPVVPAPEQDTPEPGHEPTVADRMATRNVPTARPRIDYGLPSEPIQSPPPPEEYVRPELASMGASTTALLVGRGLMVIAALLIGLAARRSTGSAAAQRGEAFWPVAASAGVFTAVAIAGLVFWSVSFADNARRLQTRAASPPAMGWSWAPVLVWVAVSSLTYLRVEVEAELDPLPGVAGLGFVVLLAIPYARLQGLFRGLSRRPPVLWVSAFPLDALAFGLVWWRLTSWPDPVTAADIDHVRLTSNVAFGVAALLLVNAMVFVWLAQRGSSSLYERLGRLEARHAADDGSRPDWFVSGLQVRQGSAPVAQRPLMNITPLTGLVGLLHVLWGISMVLFGVALARFAFEYSDRTPLLDGTVSIDDDDADRIAFVAAVVALVYVLTIIVHAVWSVLIALNARRVTVHAPNPASFGIVFAPMPVLVVAGLLIGGDVGFWVVAAGLAYAFFAVMRSNQMLMTLSGRVGGQLRGFSTWTALIGVAYLIGVVENFLFSQTAGQLGFFATATLMQGVLFGIGGVVGFRAMSALDGTLRSSRQVHRAAAPAAPPDSG